MIRLSFTMSSALAVLHDGTGTLKMKIYIKKCTSFQLVIPPPSKEMLKTVFFLISNKIFWTKRSKQNSSIIGHGLSHENFSEILVKELAVSLWVTIRTTLMLKYTLKSQTEVNISVFRFIDTPCISGFYPSAINSLLLCFIWYWFYL